MVFSSVEFLFYFFPVVLVLYYTVCAPSIHMRNILLLTASLLFYAWGEPQNIVWLLVVCVVNWLLALGIAYRPAAGKGLLLLACTVDLGILFVFKYLGFTLAGLRTLFDFFVFPEIEIALPIGISFYTFQAVSYVIDVYRGKVKAQKNPLYVALYISMFPQLVAGPIVRYSTIEEQITHRRHTWEMFSEGVSRFVLGLVKKLLLANSFAVVADNIYSLTNAGHELLSVPAALAWLGSFAYTLQIFFDFSAYSDMAIGLGKIFGFTYEENFIYPYISSSVSEFWRRWHISLSTWFREYVYFPLGGSKVENQDKMVRNLLIVWLLTGIWHGAAWTFVVWGLFNFVCILLERLFLFEKWNGSPLVKHIYTLLMVNFGWILFRCESSYQFMEYLGNLFMLNHNGFFSETAWMFLREYALVWLAGVLFSMPVIQWAGNRLKVGHPRLAAFAAGGMYPVVMGGLFFICVCYLARSGYNPFIYFNF